MGIGTGATRIRRRWKRPLIALVLLLAVGALLWQGFRQYLQVGRHAPAIAAALTDFTGLPASIEMLDVALFPTPRLSAKNVMLGGGDFKLEIADISVHVRLGALLQRELDIRSIEARPVVLHLPETSRVLRDRLSALSGRIGGTAPNETASPNAAPTSTRAAAPDGKTYVAGLALHIRRVTLEDVSIVRGKTTQAHGRVTLYDLLTPKIRLTADARAEALSKDMVATAALSLLLNSADKPHLDGSVSLHGMDLQDLLKDNTIPRTLVNLDMKVSGALPDALAGDLSGTVKTEVSESFSGTIAAQLKWTDGRLLLTNARMESPGLRLAGDLSFTPGAPLSATISSATAQEEGLRVLLALIPLSGFRLNPQEKAALTLDDLRYGPLPGGGTGLTKGIASFHGIDLVGLKPGQCLGGISGKVRVENNAVTIEEMSSRGVLISGLVRPDPDRRTVRLELAGDADLAIAPIMAFLPESPIVDAGGRLSVKHFSGTFSAEPGMPPDMELDGQLENGRFALTTSAYKDHFSGLSASFGFKNKAIHGKAGAHSERLGAVNFEGDYTPAEWLLKGTLQMDLATVVESMVPEAMARERVMPFARMLGRSAFDLILHLPGPKDKNFLLQLDRRGAPALHGSLALGQEASGTVLKQLTASAEVPLAAIAPASPIPVQTEGAAQLSLRMGAAEPGIRMDADFGGAALRLNDYVAKKPGAPLTVSIWVDPAQSNPLQSVQISLLGETILMRQTEGALRIPEMRINLASWSPLLAKGGRLSGNVSGSAELTPVSAALQLDGAGITLAPGVVIDSMTGQVHYRDGRLQYEALRVLGADSDCTFDGSLNDRALDVSVVGEKLNLNALTAMVQAFNATPAETPPGEPSPEHPESAASMSDPGAPALRLTGQAALQLGALTYGRGRVEAVRADIAFLPDEITASNITFQADKGTAQGTATLTLGTPSVLDTALTFSGIDLGLLDRLFLSESSGMRGAMTGPLQLRLPLAGGPAFSKGLNGSVDITAKNGTYGKIRLATELLTVLKSTEIVRLSIPKLRDEGLTFENSTIKLKIVDGRITVERFTIADKAYAIEGAGVIDLPADNMNLTLGFNPLKAVTGVADRLPGVKLATGLLSSGTGLRIRATGSPFNPKVRPEAGVLPIQAKPAGEGATEDTENVPGPAEEKHKGGARGVVKGLLKPVL